jgi:hypothetical protein
MNGLFDDYVIITDNLMSKLMVSEYCIRKM